MTCFGPNLVEMCAFLSTMTTISTFSPNFVHFA